MSLIAYTPDVLYQLKTETPVKTYSTMNFSGKTSCAVAGSKNTVYFAPVDNNTVLKADVSTGSIEHVFDVDDKVIKLVYHSGKLYCAVFNKNYFYCFDPLSKTTETIPCGATVLNFEPSDHGFVIQCVSGCIYGYHFNDGLVEVPQAKKAVLLGSYKRRVIALLSDDKTLVGIDENGVVTTDNVPAVHHNFCVCDDGIVELDNSKGALVFHGQNGVETTYSLPEELLPSINITSLWKTDDEGDEEPVCTLCFCEFEGDGITLDCGHCFHKDCVEQWVAKWDQFVEKAEHIVFTNAVCPGGCKHLLRHPSVPQSAKINALYKKIRLLASPILKAMGPTKVIDDLLFYICNKCGEPFYGGEKICFRMLSSEPLKRKEDVLCDACVMDFKCKKHCRNFVLYKCQYCCNPATHRSFATRYMCDACEKRWEKSEPDEIPCPGASKCPLGGNHENGSFPIGCALCLPTEAIQTDKITPPPS
ncbi:hypothetical protein AGDE_11485 [Angomonas deanei]|nr:hypothetical protein AGDE_11485 [Angomonas deanei]|eukprot:EPY26211.1 hypothetical protein AGDE_11485 [Angomonas deanei]